MVEITVEGVTKRYGATTAMDDVTFTAGDGEFFTLVGPSGCGKTTTLRTIAGFEEPDEGSIYFGDREMTGVPPEQRDVGIVFQNYALFPHMTVAENVGYGLRFRDPPDGKSDQERIDELLDLVDLSGMGDRDPDQLSGGQQQRVAIARALAPGPKVLLLDEPMSALDARLRERLRRQVRAIQSELGITTVYVTHDQEEALAISDRMAVLSGGRVEQIGPPQVVYRRPASQFVANFVGENNCFDVSVDTVETEGCRVDVGATTFTIPPGSYREGDRITVCVRPEHLREEADTNRIELAIEDWEFLGESVRVRGTWNGREILARTAEVPEGDRIAVGFDPGDAHVLADRN